MATEIKTVTKEDDEFLGICLRVNKFFQNENINDKRAKNYKIEQLHITDSVAVSVYINNDTILGVSNVLHRDIFGNGCRILNRFYKSSSYRFTKNDLHLTKSMIVEQLEICKILGFDYAFMSRESNTGATPFKHYHKKLELTNWKYPISKYKVCDNNTDNCHQYISWVPLTKNAELQLKEI